MEVAGSDEMHYRRSLRFLFSFFIVATPYFVPSLARQGLPRFDPPVSIPLPARQKLTGFGALPTLAVPVRTHHTAPGHDFQVVSSQLRYLLWHVGRRLLAFLHGLVTLDRFAVDGDPQRY